MMTEIQCRGLSITEPLRAHVEKRVNFALGRFGDRLRRVNVWLSDVNGPRGGVDMRCLIKVRVFGKPDVVVEDVQPDLYVAIDRAVSRAGRTLARRLSTHSHRGAGLPALKLSHPA